MPIRPVWLALCASVAPLAGAQTVPLGTSPQLAVPKVVAADAQINPCTQFAPSTPVLLPRTTIAGASLALRAIGTGAVSTGNGPLLDVFNHSPNSRAPRGGELVLTGRAFPVGKVAARIGSTPLELLGSTASEARFQIPASLTVENQPLIVWQEGGTPRTLTSAYTVFDPTVRIFGVVPASFAKGERVRVCGKGLGNLRQASPTAAVPMSQRMRIGDSYIDISSVEISADGSSMTFVAGGPDTFVRALRRVGTTDNIEAVFFKPEPSPQQLSGRVGLTSAVNPLSSSELQQTDVYSPGEVSWESVAPLRLNRVYSMSVFGPAPFVLLSRTEVIRNQLIAEGTGFDVATFTLGSRVLQRVASGGQLGNYFVFAVPPDAISGEFCARAGTVRRCDPGVLRVGRTPELVAPPTSVRAGTEVSLLGLALLPDPMIAGLSYRIVAPSSECGSTFELLEHTDARLRFRIVPAANATIAAQCAGRTRPALVELRGSYGNREVVMTSLRIEVAYP